MFNVQAEDRSVDDTYADLLEFLSEETTFAGEDAKKFMESIAYQGFNPVRIHAIMLKKAGGRQFLMADVMKIAAVGLVRGTKTKKIIARSQNAAIIDAIFKKYDIRETANAGHAKATDTITIARVMSTYPTVVAQVAVSIGRGQSPRIDPKVCPIWLQFVAAASIIPKEGKGSDLYAAWCHWYTEFTKLYKLEPFDPATPNNYVDAARNSSVVSGIQRFEALSSLDQKWFAKVNPTKVYPGGQGVKGTGHWL